MKYIIDTDSKLVTGPVIALSNPDDGVKTPLTDFFVAQSDQAIFSTGIMPIDSSGVLCIQRGFGFEQITYQYAPGVYKMKWGEREGDTSAKIYEFAMPWRIVVIDYKNGVFQGLRSFYSPHAITHESQQLYASNTPNINTKGYRNTSIGWICCYHRNPIHAGSTLAERIDYGLLRFGGLSEPYNDRNMIDTDGTRVYRDQGYPEYMWDRDSWALRTQQKLTESPRWICDEQLLMPLYIAENDAAATKSALMIPFGNNYQPYLNDFVPKNYSPYTVDSALNQPYSCFYDDMVLIKPFTRDLLSDQWVIGAYMRNAPGNTTMLHTLKHMLARTIVFPPELTAYTRDGMTCPHCQVRYVTPVDLSGFATCIESYEITLDSDFHILTNPSWCENCLMDDAHWMEDYSSYVSCHILMWSETSNNFYFACDLDSCVVCESYFPQAESTQRIVYNSDFTRAGCVVCCDEETYAKAADEDRLYLISQMKAINVLRYVYDAIRDIFCGVPTASWISQDSSSVLCACDLLINYDTIDAGVTTLPNIDSPVCNSCVNSCNEFAPVFVLT